MAISFRCLKCSTILQAPEASIGKPVRCPKCLTAMRVPAKPSAPLASRCVPPSTSVTDAASRAPAAEKPPSKLFSMLVLGIGMTVLMACSGLGVTAAWWFIRDTPNSKEERVEADRTPKDRDQERQKEKDEPERRADNPKVADQNATPPQTISDKGEQDPLPPLPDDLPRADVPLLIAQLPPLKKLLEDGRLLAETLDKKTSLDSWLTTLQKTISPQGAQGLDTDKPWGGYARVGDTPNAWAVVVLLPMREEASFRRLLRDLGLEEQSSVGELVPFKLPQHDLMPAMVPVQIRLPEQIYIRFAERYAHICLAGNPNLLAGDQLLAAAPMFVPRDKLLSLTLRLDRLPKAWQQQLRKIKEIKHQAPRIDNLIVQNYANQFADLLAGYADDFLSGARNLSFDLGVSRESDRLTADLYLQAAPGSRLAEYLVSLSATPSMFGSWPLRDAAFAARVNVRLPRELRAALPDLVDEATRQTLRDIHDPKERQMHERLFHTLGKTFAAGELDGTVVYRSHGAGKPGLLLGGVKVANGRAIEQLAREAVNDLDDKALRELFEMDAEKIGDVNVHRFNAQQQFPPDLRKAFGDNPWFYAFRPDALLWAGGAGVKEALPEALQARPRLTPLLLVMGDLRRLNQTMPLQAGDVKLAGEALTAKNPGRFRVELSGGKALRLHVGLDLAIFRFLWIRLSHVQLKARSEP